MEDKNSLSNGVESVLMIPVYMYAIGELAINMAIIVTKARFLSMKNRKLGLD